MASWITSDWHIGEDRMAILGRPFADGTHCVFEMLYNYNTLVKPDDLVYVVGDVLYQKADVEKWLPMVAKFNGRKILVRGNHDRGLSDADLAPYFERIYPDGARIEIEHNGVRYAVTHYPTRGSGDLFNLVGHVHGAWKVQKNMLNVGVDVHHFRPLKLDDVAFYYNAICHYYDEDVWVASHCANSGWNSRGKKGSYFCILKSGT